MSNFLNKIIKKNKVHYPWEVQEEPIFRANGTKIKSHKSIMRDDNKQILSVVKSSFTPITNESFSEVVQNMHDSKCSLREKGEYQDGKVIYATFNHPNLEKFEVMNGDEIDPKLMLINGHTGNHALKMFLHYLRLICVNGMTIPVKKYIAYSKHTVNNQERLDSFKFAIDNVINEHHNNKNNMIELTAKLDHSFDYVQWFASLMKYYKKQYPVKDESGKVIAWSEPRYSTRAKNNIQKLIDCYQDSQASGTYWGLLNAVTDFVDHHNGSRNDESYFTIGRGNDLKRLAFNQLRKYSSASA